MAAAAAAAAPAAGAAAPATRRAPANNRQLRRPNPATQEYTIGRGGYGSVSAIRHRNGAHEVRKKFNREKDKWEEYAILSRLHHERIIRITVCYHFI